MEGIMEDEVTIAMVGEDRRNKLLAATTRVKAPNPAMSGFSVGEQLRRIREDEAQSSQGPHGGRGK
jgi:hypothetical protein